MNSAVAPTDRVAIFAARFGSDFPFRAVFGPVTG